MLNLSYSKLRDSYVWFEGQDAGVYRTRYLRAVNLAVARHSAEGPGVVDEWRIPEGEFLRWLTVNNLWIYDPAAAIENFDYDRGAPFRKALKSEPAQIRIVVDESASAALKNPLEDPV